MSEELIQQELNSNNETNMSHSSLYNEIRILVESIESDVVKSEKGNKAASVRLRKALRLLNIPLKKHFTIQAGTTDSNSI